VAYDYPMGGASFQSCGPGRVVIDLPPLPLPIPFLFIQKAPICSNLMGRPVESCMGGRSEPLDLRLPPPSQWQWIFCDLSLCCFELIPARDEQAHKIQLPAIIVTAIA